jgi:hypothetical protein
MRLSATQKAMEDARNMDAAKNMLLLRKQTPQEHLHRKVSIEQLPTGKAKDVAIATKQVGMETKHPGTNSTGEENIDETDTRKADASACQKQPRKFKAPKLVRAMVGAEATKTTGTVQKNLGMNSKAVEKAKEISEEVEIISTLKRERKLSYKAQEMVFKKVKLEKIDENIASQKDKNSSASKKERNNKSKISSFVKIFPAPIHFCILFLYFYGVDLCFVIALSF